MRWRAACLIGVLSAAGWAGLLLHEPAEPDGPAAVRAPAHSVPSDPAARDPEAGPVAPERVLQDLPAQTMRLVSPDGSPVAGAVVYRSGVRLDVPQASWQDHWSDRNATMVVSDDQGVAPLPPGEGPLHVRAAGFTPASVPGDVGLWVLQPRPQVMAIAHRGGAAYAPENTLAAIHTAALMGAAWVEIDVRMTADRSLVVIHDETLDRTTNGTGLVALSTWEEVRRLDAGSWFHPSYAGEGVPALLPALRAVKAHDLGVVIELKMERAQAQEQRADLPSDALVYERTLDAINAANLSLEQTILSSFGQASSHTCARFSASACGWIARRNETSLAATSAMVSSLDFVLVDHRDIQQSLVHELQAACDLFSGQSDCPRVIAYTVRTELDMLRLTHQGVDGITSGDIGLLMRVLAAL